MQRAEARPATASAAFFLMTLACQSLKFIRKTQVLRRFRSNAAFCARSEEGSAVKDILNQSVDQRAPPITVLMSPLRVSPRHLWVCYGAVVLLDAQAQAAVASS
jgi:hypothetical protein